MCWSCALAATGLSIGNAKAHYYQAQYSGEGWDVMPGLDGRWYSPPDSLGLTTQPGAVTVPNTTVAVPAASSTSILPTTTDTVPDDISSTVTLTPNGAHIVSTLNAPGDWDFFKVELEAGKTYEFGQYAVVGGPSGVPLADAFLEIYDASGNLLQTADGGGRTPGGEAYGTDALLTFTATVSGTYFVNARSFDNGVTDGRGETVGDYEIFADVSTYKPYYDLDSPLHAIDWGTQIDRTSRNPDGAEGPRDTGNEYTGTGWNPYGITGKNVITYYFAKQGDLFIDENPLTPGTTDTMVAKGFADWEKAAYANAFGAYSSVADLVYVEVQDRTDADFILITYEGTPGDVGPSLLGRMSPPGEENEGRTEFNANDVRWTEAGLAPGGFSFTTLIHEFGHGHGLAHPHDNGGRSSVMRGVTQETPTSVADYTNGDFDLNQSVYTMMSYEDGWEKSPYGQAETTDGFGWLGGLMAFDIAAIQDKYGVNEEWKTGDDYYVLKDVNEAGTFYSCIWDAGGIDQIAYNGSKDANIDLRAATLQYEYGGGGWVSYAYGIHGGFTIANSVTIENATSGSGNDTLTGNDAHNVLNANGGDDTLRGGGGDDTLIGGLGHDVMEGGLGADLFLYVSPTDSVVGGGRDMILDFEQGEDRIDLTGIGAHSFIGAAAFSGSAGQVRYAAFDGTTIVELDRNGDRRADLQIELDEGMLLTASDFLGLDSAP
jgi:serralysin